MATTPPRLEDLNATIGEILSTPSLASYSRALSTVEDAIELATASASLDADTLALLRFCEATRVRCKKAIAQFTAEASAKEHTMYERAHADKARQNKRQGVVFNVDKGEHVAGALEALRLEEFLEEQEQEQKRKVHFS
ncbi:hypothetical protein F4803DRAFT_549836 [Xylaria telfairii]|nr:hypothetical protein F4803DRAFT_549836 [Xylaria telfairii]